MCIRDRLSAATSPPVLFDLCSQMLRSWRNHSVEDLATDLGILTEQVGPETPVGSQASQLRYWMAGQANEPRILAALDPFLVAEILVHASVALKRDYDPFAIGELLALSEKHPARSSVNQEGRQLISQHVQAMRLAALQAGLMEPLAEASEPDSSDQFLKPIKLRPQAQTHAELTRKLIDRLMSSGVSDAASSLLPRMARLQKHLENSPVFKNELMAEPTMLPCAAFETKAASNHSVAVLQLMEPDAFSRPRFNQIPFSAAEDSVALKVFLPSIVLSSSPLVQLHVIWGLSEGNPLRDQQFRARFLAQAAVVLGHHTSHITLHFVDVVNQADGWNELSAEVLNLGIDYMTTAWDDTVVLGSRWPLCSMGLLQRRTAMKDMGVIIPRGLSRCTSQRLPELFMVSSMHLKLFDGRLGPQMEGWTALGQFGALAADLYRPWHSAHFKLDSRAVIRLEEHFTGCNQSGLGLPRHPEVVKSSNQLLDQYLSQSSCSEADSSNGRCSRTRAHNASRVARLLYNEKGRSSGPQYLNRRLWADVDALARIL
eukprot:TRINITY_DN8694_c0_g1_i5.p1 TRINITY_DN8694_c0_g1~~TRINITY_DN8694_c0_g1_i5.p1  ORF type:complete len:543 (+),score=112.77 TRINITY_DN8694_c0_g1_i5:130-1758(+)